MNDKVEYIEFVCDTNIREIEIAVNVPLYGGLTMAYARGVFDEIGLRELRVTIGDDYKEIYHDNQGLVFVNHIDKEYVEQIKELLNKQL